MQTTMAAAAAAVCLMPAAEPADSLYGVARIQREKFSFIGRPPQHSEKIQALAFSVYSPSARSGSQEVRGSSSALRVASMFRAVTQQENEGEVPLPTSALAIAAAAASVSSTPFGFLTKIGNPGRMLSTPSAEFLALCSEQLSLCEKIVGIQTNLTVYVRTAESYASGQLEFFLAASYPKNPSWSVGTYKEVLMLTDKSESQGSVGDVESALVHREALELPESSALVLPLVKDMFLVGFLVAERSVVKVTLRAKKAGILKPVRPSWPPKEKPELLSSAPNDRKEVPISKTKVIDDQHPFLGTFTKEQQAETAKIARTLALACVMDQRSVLLQHSSWQRGVHIDNLVDQVRGPLMAVRTLGKMLLPHLKRGEISRDVVEDILVQGNRMNDVVQQLQKVLYLTNSGASSPQFGEESLNGLKGQSVFPKGDIPEEGFRSKQFKSDGLTGQSSHSSQRTNSFPARPALGRDEESPMPPLALAAPPEENISLCNVSEVLYQLVRAASSLAQQKNQSLQLKSSSQDIPLMAAIDELSLRQALSNLLEYSIQHTPAGGWISAEVMRAPGGGVLLVIEDNGPDMGLLVQERLLGPLGSVFSGSSKGNAAHDGAFEAGLRLITARELLEQSSAVLTIKSPHLVDAPIGVGGTHVEIWLPGGTENASLGVDVRETSSK
ncbi:unnamed protein product [Calypogeia fissa]